MRNKKVTLSLTLKNDSGESVGAKYTFKLENYPSLNALKLAIVNHSLEEEIGALIDRLAPCLPFSATGTGEPSTGDDATTATVGTQDDVYATGGLTGARRDERILRHVSLVMAGAELGEFFWSGTIAKVLSDEYPSAAYRPSRVEIEDVLKLHVRYGNFEPKIIRGRTGAVRVPTANKASRVKHCGRHGEHGRHNWGFFADEMTCPGTPKGQ